MASLPWKAKQRLRQLLKSTALRAISFIIARPRLDDFLRRQVYRFPGIAGRMRAAVAHSRRSNWQTLPPVLSDEAELSDDARLILQDLTRAADRVRTP